jgi:hypothetical protein
MEGVGNGTMAGRRNSIGNIKEGERETEKKKQIKRRRRRK